MNRMLATWLLLTFQGLCSAQDYAQIVKLHGEAKAALARELERENAGDCKGIEHTNDLNICIGEAAGTTQANYKTFATALRSLFDPESAKAFDLAKSAWNNYCQLQVTAAHNLFRGGSAATYTGVNAAILLIRSHMRELEAVYRLPLNN